ncbi:uncharacterized protein LOC143198771 [Rhynchophorus ferrugineus]|uniref:uncharacterized protein LOC143198771 n=1 Tax=Rhynchophorus ferrugineus TaxID=354439 RepID=UPI003FCD4376
MQSKLPVRVNRRHILEKKDCECDCNKIFQTILQTPSDGVCNFCLNKGLSADELLNQCTKQSHSKMTELNTQNIFTNHTELLTEVKQMLSHINTNLEAILLLLKDRKEYFYNQLQDSNIKNKKIRSSNRKEKIKEKFLIKAQPYRWPDISRFYWQPSFCIKNLNQHHKPNDTKGLIFCPFRRNILYTDKPLSCPNINYFQTMGKLFDKNSISISMYSFPIITLSNQLDNYNKDQTKNKDESKSPNKEILQIK